MLQDPLIGKEADLLINGTVYFFSNTARTTLKNVYYQSGTVAPYDYIPLPNPMTLSASGTMVDVGGADIIPGYYPFSETDNTTVETYFIQVFNSDGELIFTRYNFPIQPTGGITPVTGVEDIKQLVVNNRFWRNVGTQTLTNTLSSVVAPDQHDGFSTGTAGASGTPVNGILSDITFNKDVIGSAETVTFTKFPLQSSPVLTGDITPEFYLHHVATDAVGAETIKYYQFPISLHLRTLSAVSACVSIQAKGTGTITLSIFQFQGTGQVSTASTPIKTIPLTNAWTKYSQSTELPPDFGTTVDSGPGDDAIYLWVGLPASATCDISFTLPSIYLINDVNEIPINDFRSYDEINAIICSPRTGDVRTSLNSVYPFGWAPMNDGTIGSAASNPTAMPNLATGDNSGWPLFNLLWSNFHSYGATVFPIYTSGGIASTYGASAIADWNANKSIALTQLMGEVILGTVPVSALLSTYKTTFTATGSVITTGNSVNFFIGMPVYVTGGSIPAALSANTIYYVSGFNGTTGVTISATFALAITGTNNLVFGAGSGTIGSALTGSFEGEYAHVQLPGEVGAHTHPASATSTVSNAAAGAFFAKGDNSGTNTATVTSVIVSTNTPNSSPMNNTQPGTFCNLFIKL